MTKTTWITILMMAIFSLASVWKNSFFCYPFLIGFASVTLNGIAGKVTLRECGLNFLSVCNLFEKGTNRKLFFYPLIVVAAEILVGKIVFGGFSQYALARIDGYLIFNNSTTLLGFTLILIVIEEVPWRCHFQLNIGRRFPNGWALLLPAICISILATPLPIDTLSIYCLVGFFLRRIFWGMLYESTGSLWTVVLSHYLSTMFYLILLVGS